jgi:hypothetical protein
MVKGALRHKHCDLTAEGQTSSEAMTKRTANMIAAVSLVLVFVGVVYATVGFTSAFSCETGSDCFLPRFFAITHDLTAAPSATLTSVALAPAEEELAIPATQSPATPSAPLPQISSVSAEPTVLSSELPLVVDAAKAARPRSVVEDAAPSVAEKVPATETAPIRSSSKATPPPAVPTAAMEPEPGVLTDPPAGVVSDPPAGVLTDPPAGVLADPPAGVVPEEPSTNAPPPPNFLPILIVPPRVSAPRAH